MFAKIVLTKNFFAKNLVGKIYRTIFAVYYNTNTVVNYDAHRTTRHQQNLQQRTAAACAKGHRPQHR